MVMNVEMNKKLGTMITSSKYDPKQISGDLAHS